MQTFDTVLPRYVNGALIGPGDRFLSRLGSRWPYVRHAGTVMRLHRQVTALAPGKAAVAVGCAPYAGANRYVLEMKAFLRERLPEALTEAVVHGSLGTGEEMGYSDFDALVVLRDHVFERGSSLVRTAAILGEARRIMLSYDPLQHHGWFVLAEASLKRYPAAYFPTELFAYSRSLLHDTPFEMTVRWHEPVDYRSPFHRLCRSLLRKLAGPPPAQAYALKSLLSEFLLLPALYVQARDGKGLFKKFTFESARGDFAAETWSVMADVSEVRTRWRQILADADVRRLTARPDRKRNFLPASTVPAAAVSCLHPEFLRRMAALVTAAQQKMK